MLRKPAKKVTPINDLSKAYLPVTAVLAIASFIVYGSTTIATLSNEVSNLKSAITVQTQTIEENARRFDARLTNLDDRVDALNSKAIILEAAITQIQLRMLESGNNNTGGTP